MNCKQCQQKILDALAAGHSHLAPEIAAHKNSCLACASFCDRYQSLFHSIDAGLRSFVNQPLPPSLLPRVRARLDEKPVAQRFWSLSWNLAAVAVLTLLAVVLGHVRHTPTPFAISPEQTSTTSQRALVPQLALQHTQQSQPRLRRVIRASARHTTPTPSSPATPEVIVLAEERQAFAKFAAEVPEEPQVAVALARPATAAPDAPIEIALLHIDRIELKALDSGVTE